MLKHTFCIRQTDRCLELPLLTLQLDHCKPYLISLALCLTVSDCSKSSPSAATYDKPGLPFSRLLEATGCTFGPKAIACLQSVPFEVSNETDWDGLCLEQ